MIKGTKKDPKRKEKKEWSPSIYTHNKKGGWFICASITCEKKDKKRKKKKAQLYMHTKQREKGLYVHLYKGKKEKRKRQNKEPVYMHTKKDRKEKRKTPVYMHTKLLEESACVHLYRGKEKRKKRMWLYLHTKRGCVCSYNGGKKDERKDEKAGSPLFFCTALLHFFALQMYAPLTRGR